MTQTRTEPPGSKPFSHSPSGKLHQRWNLAWPFQARETKRGPGKDPQIHFSRDALCQLAGPAPGASALSGRTCGSLKRIHRALQPSLRLPIAPGPQLCVEGSDVKENAGFLQ